VRVDAWLRRAAPGLAVVAVAIVVLLFLAAAAPALAQVPPVPPAPPAPPPPPSLSQVLDSARNWLVALLASLATLFLTIGGLRYMGGAADPGEVEKAKTAVKAAAIGYALAALAPLAVGILKSIVGV
jgi:protein-S-isoprenylcysteine O-methyltransferase Ste14